jgi:NADH-quinone oxidoreductase subunit L
MLAHEGGAEHHSLVPLFTSLVVALGGLIIGWLVYSGQRQSKTDPLQMLLGPLYNLLKNKYYIDEIYSVIFIRPVIWLAETFSSIWIDRKVIDGIVEGIGKAALWIGKGFRNLIDIPLVNGAGDGLAKGTRGFGAALKPVQTGRVQQYMVVTLGALILAGAVLYYFLVMA